MILIQRVYRATLPIDRARIEQVQVIFRQNFSEVQEYADKIPQLLDG